jgi:hypothetical protein
MQFDISNLSFYFQTLSSEHSLKIQSGDQEDADAVFGNERMVLEMLVLEMVVIAISSIPIQ